MRHGNTAGFFGIIIKVCLSKHVCVVTDNLDGVLVCSNSTVSSQTPELTVDGPFRCGNRIFFYFQRKVGYIIIDTDGESFFLSVVVYSDNLSRCGIFGT